MKKTIIIFFELLSLLSCDYNRRKINDNTVQKRDTSYEVWAKDSMNGYKVYIKGNDTIIEDYGAKPE